MVRADAFRDQPVLTGERVRLEPLGPAVLDAYWTALHEPEGRRLTGTHARFTVEQTERWLATRADHHDRADWAAIIPADGSYLGEAVLNDLDPDNESCGFRIALAGPHLFGQGLGTEITRLVVGYALDTVGLLPLELQVYALSPREKRV